MRDLINRPEWVKQQYADDANLNARIALHKRFSTSDEPWTAWVFDRIAEIIREQPAPDYVAPVRLLEVGAGPGNLWSENAERIPTDWQIVLSDLSPGMASTAKRNLAEANVQAGVMVASAEAVPVQSGACAAVLANHMLYHVTDRARALKEFRRVLRSDGVLIAATNGEGHMRELHELAHRFDPTKAAEDPVPRKFSLESGERQVREHFSEVSVVRKDNMLVVTEVEPLAAYMLSGSPTTVSPEQAVNLSAFLEEELAGEGVIRITPETGLLIARGPLPV
jgi:SAM-dependent methyltransferase